MYILLGVPIGFVLWFLIMLLSNSILGEVNDVIFIASLGVCFVIGCFIGDLIGRTRHYKDQNYKF